MNTLYKEDFTYVLILFDYERHDSIFSEGKIDRMQKHFNEVSDIGQLYLSYPMIESYLECLSTQETSFADRITSANIQRGTEYKQQFNHSNIITLI